MNVSHQFLGVFYTQKSDHNQQVDVPEPMSRYFHAQPPRRPADRLRWAAKVNIPYLVDNYLINTSRRHQ
jgi:hypothetical protein